MYRKINENEKMNIVTQYADGQSVASLCSQFNLSRSTVYSWINRYQTLKSSSQTNVTLRDFTFVKGFEKESIECVKIRQKNKAERLFALPLPCLVCLLSISPLIKKLVISGSLSRDVNTFPDKILSN
jgi:transposase-like protein